ncbi:MAG: carboxypeptidase regulatory-like domain-containing protein, partial [Vicinamibacterales bacterium]
MWQLVRVVSTAAVVLLAWCSAASAQSTIAGRVTDETNAVLPGVDVVVASPALIEGSRSAVTDAQGRYTIIDLRPGIYAVTFTLSGFSTVKREAIEVGSNVTVPINAEMAVGALEETVTVAGATPVVDVQAAARREVLARDALNALPTNRTWISAGAIVPGARMTKPDVGGTEAVQQAYVTARGMAPNDNGMQIDGMDVKPNNEAGNQQYPNFAMVQEVTYQTSAISADTSAGGVRINMIPREGGNRFAGEMFYSMADGDWQSRNINQVLLDRGLVSTTSTDLLYDVNPGFGGPVLRDRLWFFGSYRRLVVNTRPAGAFFRDGRPAIEDQWIDSGSVRLTWQATAGNKITMYGDRQWKGKGHDFTDGVPAEVTKAGIDPET